MLGKLDPQHREVTVIGAGIAGLLSAYRLEQAGYQVTLLEAQSRAGGLISTRRTEFGLVETAAHSLLASDAVRDLFRALGLRTVEVAREAKARYIFRSGKMRRMPLSFPEIAGLLRHSALVKAPADDSGAGRTLEEWGRAHLGQAALDYLLSPFLVGIYGASPSELDLEATFPGLNVPAGKTLFGSLWGKERQSSEGKRRMVSLEGGMASLVEALVAHLHKKLGGRFRLGARIDQLPPGGNTVLAVPAPVASQLLRSVLPRASSALGAVRYAPLVSCTVFVRNDRHRPPRGVGVLFPPKEGHPILGVLFNSSAFSGRVAHESVSSYTVMLGGTQCPEALDWDDGEIHRVIESEFQTLFGLRGGVEHIEISRWKNAVPVYSRELRMAWDVIGTELSSRAGWMLFGNYSGKVSLRGMIEDSRLLIS